MSGPEAAITAAPATTRIHARRRLPGTAASRTTTPTTSAGITARVSLSTMEIQAPRFYLKQGYEMAARLDCDPPGVNRYLMTKRLTPGASN